MATRYSLNVRALDVVGVAGVVTVTCQLCDSDHDPVVGYTDDGEIVDKYAGYTDSDGELTLSLVANSAITPANTYYSLRVGSRRFLIEKAASDNETVQDALAGSPAALASALALGQLSDVDTAGATDGQVLAFDADTDEWGPVSVSSDPAMGGDLSGTASNAQIIANAVGTNEIADDAVTPGKLDRTYIESDLVDAKGDLIVATAADTPARLAVGADGTVPVADAAATAGMSWAHHGTTLTSPGRYTTVPCIRTSPLTVTTNRATYVPYLLRRRARFDRIGVVHVNTQSAHFARLGIYGSTADAPGALVLDAGTIDLSTAPAFKEITINQTLAPGLYWLAAVKQGGSQASEGMGSTHPLPFALPVTTGGSAVGGAYYEDGVSGALPANATPNTTLAVPGILVYLREAA